MQTQQQVSGPEALVRALDAAGQRAVVYRTADGTRLVLLAHGARILGLYPGGSGENFYWINRGLLEAAPARALFAAEGWHNTGGDRTWLTPELDIFFPDYPACRTHWEPPQLDAVEYAVRELEDGGGVTMSARMRLALARPGREVELALSKSVAPAPNPLRREREAGQWLEQTAFAGYTQTTRLELLDPGAATGAPALGIWNLIQLPHGGDLLVSTYTRTQPRVLFGEVPSAKLSASERMLRWRVDYPGEHKIAVRAAARTGRVGYLWSRGDVWSLVVRNFQVNPSGDYVDVPKDDPDDLGYAVHAVNVDSALGDFCEMEYHAPAMETAQGAREVVDRSQVWAWRGPRETVRAIAAQLLGPEAAA